MFTPFKLRDLVLSNRVVVSPMCQYVAEDGMPNEWHLVHLGSRAIGGAGPVFCGKNHRFPGGGVFPGGTGKNGPLPGNRTPAPPRTEKDTTEHPSPSKKPYPAF